MELLGNALSYGKQKGKGVRLLLGTTIMDTAGKLDYDQLRTYEETKELPQIEVPTKWLLAASPAEFDPGCDGAFASPSNCSVLGQWFSCGGNAGLNGCSLYPQLKEPLWLSVPYRIGYPSELWQAADGMVWNHLRAMVTGKISKEAIGARADVLASLEEPSASGAIPMSGLVDRAYWVSDSHIAD